MKKKVKSDLTEREQILRKYGVRGRAPWIPYSNEAKQNIIAALFPELNEEQQAERIQHFIRTPDYVRPLCADLFHTLQALKDQPELIQLEQNMREKVTGSLEKQKEDQQAAIDHRMVKRITYKEDQDNLNSLINYNVLVDHLGHRLRDMENKFQLSWSPLFDDTNNMEHSIIERNPRAVQQDPRPIIIANSVYDVKKMPLPLLDLALHGERKSGYPIAEKFQLLTDAAEHIDDVKKFLIDSRPLKHSLRTPTSRNDIDRIVSLWFGGKKVGYLLSETTPIIYPDKSQKKYINNFIRYQIFDNTEDIKTYLYGQLEPSKEKIGKWQKWTDDIKEVIPKLSEIYADDDKVAELAQGVQSMTFGGHTRVEQKLKQLIKSLSFTNIGADRPIYNAMQKLLSAGYRDQEEKFKHLTSHIDALEEDNEF